MSINKNKKVNLRRKFQRHCETGLIISLVVVIMAFLYFPHIERSEVVMEELQELVDVEDVVITKHDVAPPPPPKPIIPIETPSDEILEDIEIEDTDLDMSEVVEAPPPQLIEEEKEEELEPTFFIAVEEMPSPIGGIVGIQRKIIYPEIAKRAGVQGRVYVKAFVDETGKVQKVEVIKGIGAGCDEAAVDAVLNTRFNPGKQRGKPVKVQVSIPIKFVLTENV
ncbi:MAG: energy transducer TonB [Melioribacteraceae bacterium]|nr:energy transducer TonB [Melioribacteraceae bacterium]